MQTTVCSLFSGLEFDIPYAVFSYLFSPKTDVLYLTTAQNKVSLLNKSVQCERKHIDHAL